MDTRGVHGESHHDGTYFSGLGERRTIKELKLQTRLMTFYSFFSEIRLVRDDIVDDFGPQLYEGPSYLCQLCSACIPPVSELASGAVRTSFHPSARRWQRCSTTLVATSLMAPRSALLS